MVLDPVTKALDFVETGREGKFKWSGICAHDGKVFFCPSNDTSVMVLDPVTKALDFVETGREGGFKWSGLCAHDGKVFFCPFDDTAVMVQGAQFAGVQEYQCLLKQTKETLLRKKDSLMLGVQLKWVFTTFADFVRPGLERLNFHELAQILAYGEHSIGKGLKCPRDGRPDCSIADAIFRLGEAKRATVFLSWVWGYTFNIAESALREWLKTQDQCTTYFVWWCFFCNNQARLLGDGTTASSEELDSVFIGNLNSVGKMICMLDSYTDPMYLTRVWCIYEVFRYIEKNKPIEIIAPTEAKEKLKSMQLTDISKSFESVDIKKGKATKESDQNYIMSQIGSRGDDVNKKVKMALVHCVTRIIMESVALDQHERETKPAPACCEIA